MKIEDMISNGTAKRVPSEPDFALTGDARVFYFKANKWMEKKIKTKKGYVRFSIKRNGKIKTLALHVMMAETFLGGRPKEYHVRHLDGNSLNNDITNLAYGTPKENVYDSIRHGKIAIGKKLRKSLDLFTEEEIFKMREFKKYGLSNRAISEIYKTSEATVSDILLGKIAPSRSYLSKI